MAADAEGAGDGVEAEPPAEPVDEGAPPDYASTDEAEESPYFVEVYNDYGSTTAMAYPEASHKPGATFMVFGAPKGVQGSVTSTATDAHFLPYYKGAWGNIRRIGSMPDWQRKVSTKSRLYGA